MVAGRRGASRGRNRPTVRITGDDRDLQRTLNRSSRSIQAFAGAGGPLGRLGGVLGGLPGLVLAVGGAFAGMAAQGFQAFAQLESQMIRFRTLTGQTRQEMETLEGVVGRISRRTGFGEEQVLAGLYPLASGGLRGGALEGPSSAIADLALVLGIDPAAAAGTIQPVVNAFQGTGHRRGAEQYLAAQVESQLLPEQFAAALPTATTQASLAGLSSAELFASFAAYSQADPNAARVATGISEFFRNVLAPSETAIGRLGEAGLSSTALRSAFGRSLTEGVEQLQQIAPSELTRIFGATGGTFASVLQTAGPEGIQATLNQIRGGSFGALDEAAGEQIDSTLSQWNIAMDTARDALRGLGETVAPVVTQFLNLVPAVESIINLARQEGTLDEQLEEEDVFLPGTPEFEEAQRRAEAEAEGVAYTPAAVTAGQRARLDVFGSIGARAAAAASQDIRAGRLREQEGRIALTGGAAGGALEFQAEYLQQQIADLQQRHSALARPGAFGLNAPTGSEDDPIFTRSTRECSPLDIAGTLATDTALNEFG